MKSAYFNFLLAFILLFAVSASAQNQPAQNLNAQQFSEKLKQTPDAILLDVRTPEEYKVGHLAGAKNVNWFGKDFDKQIAAIDKKQPVFVYCLSGGRSEEAATLLRKQGFGNVFELEGGITAWKEAKLPVVEKSKSGKSKQSRF